MRVPIFCLILTALLAWPTDADAQQLRDVERSFRRAEKSLCQSLKLKDCRTSNARKVVPKDKPQKAASLPVPKPRPDKVATRERPKQLEQPEKLPVQQATASVPLPILRPETIEIDKTPTTSTLKPQPSLPVRRTAPGKAASLVVVQPECRGGEPVVSGCAARLGALGVTFKPVTLSGNDAKCAVNEAMQISEVKTANSEITFPDQPILNCEFAAAFVTWIKSIASPVTKATANKALVSVSTGPGYDCRGRNGDSTAKMSEHATGNAVDIEAIKLSDDLRVPVTDNTPTLKALRTSACEHFTTVLGPGSNAAHASHFHFDMAKRKGNYRICE